MSRLSIIAALAFCGVLASCNAGGEKNKEGKKGFEFQEYSYEAVAEAHPDSVNSGAMMGDVAVSGRGIYPVCINGNDLMGLCAALDSIAGLEPRMADGEFSPSLPQGTTKWLGEQKDSPAETISTTVEVVLANPEMIVFRGFSTSMSEGAAHGMYATSYVNYFVKDNKVLGVWDLLKKGNEKEVTGLVREKLQESGDDVFDDAEVTVPETFQVTPEGITFLYGLYQIAPYSSGEIAVSLDAYELYDYLTPLGFRIFGMEE